MLERLNIDHKLIHRYVNGVTLDSHSKSVVINPEYEKEVLILKELTWTYVIEAPTLAMQREGQRAIVRRLFNVYADTASSPTRWAVFPPYYREQLEQCSSKKDRIRVVIDLIAGMTEPQAIELYRQSIGASQPASLEDVVR